MSSASSNSLPGDRSDAGNRSADDSHRNRRPVDQAPGDAPESLLVVARQVATAGEQAAEIVALRVGHDRFYRVAREQFGPDLDPLVL